MHDFWERFAQTLGLAGEELESEKLYHIGTGSTVSGETCDLFIRPCQKSLIRLDWKDQPINCQSLTIVLPEADEVGICQVLVDTMRVWAAGSLPEGLETFVAAYTDKVLPVHANGRPRQWLAYACTPLAQSFASLYDYQLFDADKMFQRSSADAAQLMSDWWDFTRTGGRHEPASANEWRFLGTHFEHETGCTILRVRNQDGG